MQGQSPSGVIKPEVRRISAYTLKHVKADVKLDQNENPYELPQDLKEEVARRVLARHGALSGIRSAFDNGGSLEIHRLD
jgi:hypothetical protein